jgi:hypothetical protein
VCFGISPCLFRVEDNITVLYYDDPSFDQLTDQTRCCNNFLTWLCGGEGETVVVRHTCCFGLCLRCVGPSFVPFFCGCLPLVKEYPIGVADANEALYKIKNVRADARKRLGIED